MNATWTKINWITGESAYHKPVRFNFRNKLKSQKYFN